MTARRRRIGEANADGVAALRRHRLRVTPQRVAVLRAVANGNHVAPCQDIWARAQAEAPGLGQMTVYRILEDFRAAGLVERLEVRGAAHFGLAASHHDHTICERCGTVAATDSCLLEGLTDATPGARGFLVTRHRVDLIGVCARCREAERTRRRRRANPAVGGTATR